MKIKIKILSFLILILVLFLNTSCSQTESNKSTSTSPITNTPQATAPTNTADEQKLCTLETGLVLLPGQVLEEKRYQVGQVSAPKTCSEVMAIKTVKCGHGKIEVLSEAAGYPYASCFSKVISNQETPVNPTPIPIPVVDPPANPTPAPAPAPIRAPIRPPHPVAPSTTLQHSLSTQWLTLLNQYRQNNQRCGSRFFPAARPLKWDRRLEKSAYAHSDEMSSKNYFSHRSDDGRDFLERMAAQNYYTNNGAENIAAGKTTIESTLQQWMESPEHCKNIMNPQMKNVGIGKAYSHTSYYKFYWTMSLGAE